MQTQLFTGATSLLVLLRAEAQPAPDPKNQEILKDLKARLACCANLGLTAQFHTLMTYFKAFYLRQAVPISYPFLIGDQEGFLRELFPTRYTREVERDSISMSRTLADYAFDLIPRSVLETWNECTQQGLFSDYEIWTAEQRAQPDPVLIGRRPEHPFPYLIARWGDALLSWEQLVRRLPRGARPSLEMTTPSGLLPGEPALLLENSNGV